MTVERVNTHPNTRDYGRETTEGTCLGHMCVHNVWSKSSKDLYQADERSNVVKETRTALET